jgi:hypothetical protein
MRGIAKLPKLTHHRILSHERGMQTADHLDQKPICIAPKVGLRTRFIRKGPGLAPV